MEEKRGGVSTGVLLSYLVVFYGLWILWEFLGKRLVDRAVETEWLAQLIKSGLVKNLVWTLPSILLIYHFGPKLYVSPEEMFSRKAEWRRFLPLLGLSALYIAIGSVLKNGRVQLSSEFGLDKIIIVLFVGVTEELVFRGWLLNAMVPKVGRQPAVILNGVLFVAIHIPKWICAGWALDGIAILSAFEVGVLGVVFCEVFLRSKKLQVPLVLHMFWDFLAFLLV